LGTVLIASPSVWREHRYDRRTRTAGRRAKAVLLAVALMAAGCSRKKPPAPPPPQVGYVQLTSGPVTITSELAGRTAAPAIADVRPQVDGILQARLFKEGALVHRGEALYQVDPSPYIAARDQAASLLANARAAVVAARLQAERNLKLGPQNGVSQQTVDNSVATAGQAEATVRQEEAALRAAEINLAWTTVRAPITGRIGRSLATVGDLVSASQPNALSTITSLDPIFVDVTQSSDALVNLRRALTKGHVAPASTRVRLTFTDGTAYGREGELKFGEVTVDENSGTVTLRARFPNPDDLLLPGMFVRLVTPQAVVPRGILAPQQGVARTPTGAATALVIGPDGRIVQRELELGPAVGNTWLVFSGLAAGDRLVVEGTDKVKPGEAVRGFPVTLPKME
jgi:membrane fusion protein (multidrug efflux system)